MKLLKIVQWFVMLKLTIAAVNVTNSKWNWEPSLDGLLFQSGKLSIYFVDQFEDCLTTCNGNQYCLSVVYNNISGFCQEYSEVFYNSSHGADNEGSRYYKIVEDSCRSLGYQLSDDMTFCYKVNPDMNYDYYEARDKCKKEGGHLLVVDTVEKQNYTAKMLLNTPEWMNSHSYYIDGSDSETEGEWIFSSGAAMPMSKDFWGGLNPDQMGDEDCVVMTTTFSFNFDWNDVVCTLKKGYICERQLITTPATNVIDIFS